MIYTHIAAAVIAALAAWFIQGNRYDVVVADLKLQHADLVVSAHKTALRTTEIYRDNANEAIQRANLRSTKNLAAASALRAELDGLRGDLADVPQRIAGATREAVNQYAVTASAVFEHCARRHSEVADAATGHASDVQTFDEAWPVKPSPTK